MEEATERAIEQAAAEAGKPRAAGQDQAAPPDEHWKETLGALRAAGETEHRATADANASAHEALHALRVSAGANISRLEEHISRLQMSAPSLRALDGGGRSPAPALAAAATTTALVGATIAAVYPAAATYPGLLAGATQPSAVAAADEQGSRVVATQGARGSVEESGTDYSPAASLGAAQAAQAAQAVESSSLPDVMAPPRRAAAADVQAGPAASEAVALPPPTNPCAGKRCPAQYDMVDRGDHCTCRPATATANAPP